VAVAVAFSGLTGGAMAQNTMGNILNNQGIVTQGQSGGTNIVVQKPPPRDIDDRFRNLIRENFADKSKPMQVKILAGDDAGERARFASQIEDFLRNDGYTLKPQNYFLSTGGPPPTGVVIDQYSEPGTIWVMVGINNRQ
jgi:hypothetical protein